MSMRALVGFLLLAGAVRAGAQEPPEAALERKIDTLIPWISDGTRLVDGTPQPPVDPAVDRPGLLRRAQEAARERHRLILWYCMKVPGTHTYRSPVLDLYMRAALFTDPDLAGLIRAKFVPLRMAADEPVSAGTGIRFPGLVEPGLIVLSPEGRVLEVVDRIRTFNAGWTRGLLVRILRKYPDYNAPAGDSVAELLAGGDDDRALDRATADQKAQIYRHAGRFREVLGLPCGARERGIACVALGDFEGARTLLGQEESAEALYYLSAVDGWTGKNPEPVWRRLVERYPDSPWAWRAAANLVRGQDDCRQGPLPHQFEDFSAPPPEQIVASTRLPSDDYGRTVRRAVEFLLRSQQQDGAWTDSRYSYGWAHYMIRRRIKEGLLDPAYTSWPDTSHHPNVYLAVTALAAEALYAWREAAPDRIDRALAQAERYLLDDSRVARGCCEECFAEALRLRYFTRKKDVSRMNHYVARVARLQDADGFWGHEYPSAFATAAIVHGLSEARRAGADVPEALLARAAGALERTRHEDGRQDYRYEPGKPPSSEKNSMGRTALSELALLECGRGSVSRVASGLEAYWKHLERLETVRTCDNHADQELAGFFFFYSVFHTLQAARALEEPARTDQLRRFRAQILSIPEIDGSFVDSHEQGKGYGTAMALLALHDVEEDPRVVDLWPGPAPDDAGIAGAEKFFPLIEKGKPYEVGGRPTKVMTNVSQPSLTVYRPAPGRDTGVTMIICPGGGYHNLVWDVEGEEVASWLTSIGMTAVLLKYRCPRRPGDAKGVPPLGPLKDAQRAVSLVRSRAREWGIDPARIGMVGFSAGGHLVGATATHFEERAYAPQDEADRQSCRPDFAIMLYSGYFKGPDGLSPTIREAAGAPPMLLIHASDDPTSNVEHSITFYLAMKRIGVPVELHVYATGGHGFGVRKVGQPCETWTDRSTDWLRSRGILREKG